MDLTQRQTIKDLLEKYQAPPKKLMGQNFLADRGVLLSILEAAQLQKEDAVIEIGPGIGTLTKELAQQVKKVIAIEKDHRMVSILQETLSGHHNVEIINEDALVALGRYTKTIKDYKVVANIPYYMTSFLIRSLLEATNQPSHIILMVQKEIAQRICAKPPHMSLLSVSVQYYGNPHLFSPVKKESFWPSPKVDSAILAIEPKNTPHPDNDLFFEVVKAGFSHPRKQLVNNLSVLKDQNGIILDKHRISQWLLENQINPRQRAQTLSIDDWARLVRVVSNENIKHHSQIHF